MPEADSEREHDDDQQAGGDTAAHGNAPKPDADDDPVDSEQVLADITARSKTAGAELERVKARKHTDRELLEAQIASTAAILHSVTKKTADMLRALAKKRAAGTPAHSLDALRANADSGQFQAQFLRDELEAYRRDLADLLSRELTDANVEAARQAAKAARTTARATVWLAIATFVLIAATIVAAVIAASGGT